MPDGNRPRERGLVGASRDSRHRFTWELHAEPGAAGSRLRWPSHHYPRDRYAAAFQLSAPSVV